MHKADFNKKIEKMIKYLGFIFLVFAFFLCFKSATQTYASEYKNKKLPKGIILQDGRFINKKDNSTMTLIPAGKFIMGDNDGSYNEKPEHKVYLDTYLIDIYEITNAQFEKFISEAGYKPQGPWRRGYQHFQEDDNHPVRFTTWYDAYAYAKWAGKRLPTEAEWEKASKGITNNKYPWGNDWDNKFSINIESFKSYEINAFPKSVSGYGCFNMGGGVWEWVNDWYDRYYYNGIDTNQTVVNPRGPEDNAGPEKRFLNTKWNAAGNERSTLKVIRGGGNWSNLAKDNARASKRMWGNPSYWFNDTGFRCAKSIEDASSN